MIDANTIVGDPISTPDGITLIPVSKVTFGFAGGGSDFSQKQNPVKGGFGGGTGAGVNITPVAFMVVNGKDVSLIYVTPTALSTVDRLIDTVPDVITKVTEFLDKDKD